MRNETTSELFVRYRDHADLRALAEVFERTGRELLRVAGALAPEASAAEDLLQATFLKAIESSQRFDASRRVEPWLVGILANEARNLRRRERRGPAELAHEPAVDADPLHSAAGSEVARLVDDALTRLPAHYREVLVPHLRGGRSGNEIARELGRSPGTVRMQLSRALGRLRAALPPSFATGALVAWLSPRSAARARVRRSVLERAALRAGAVSRPSTSPWLLGGITMSAKIALVPLVLLAAVAAWKLAPETPDPARPTIAAAPERNRTELVELATPAQELTPPEERSEVAAERVEPAENDAYVRALAGVHGRIVEHDRTPVVHAPIALVELEPLRILSGTPGAGLDDLRAPSMLATVAVTDAEGYFELRGTRPHAVHALAIDPRGPRSTLIVLERALASAEVADLGELVLPPAAELAGRVVDARGRPVPGARVRTLSLPESMHVGHLRPLANLRAESALALIDDDEAAVIELEPWIRDAIDCLPLPTTHTDAEGRFALRASLDPEAIVIADHPGLAAAVVGPLTPASGASRVALGDVVLDVGTPLEARVLDAAGEPIDDAEVLLGRVAVEDILGVLQPAERAGRGRYTLDGLADWGRAVVAVRHGRDAPWHVQVAESVTTEEVEVRLAPEITVELHVNDSRGAAVRDLDFAWMPESLLSDDSEFEWLGHPLPLAVRAISAGRYETLLRPGEHLLWVTSSTTTSRHAIEIEPSSHGETATVELALPAARTFAIEVVDAATGEPVPRARASVLDDARWPVVHAAASTDTRGLASLPSFATHHERLLVTVQHPAYAVATSALETGSNPVRVELDRGGSIAGHVTFTGRRPQQSLLFNLTTSSRGWSPTGRVARFAHIDADGTFELKRVPAGEYRWEVATNFQADLVPLALGGRMEEYYDMDKGHFEDTWSRGTVTVSANEVARVDPVVEPRSTASATIQGQLLVHGVPRAGALLELDDDATERTTRTDAGGRFVFRDVAPGEVRVDVVYLDPSLGSTSAGRGMRRQVDVSDGEIATVEIDLSPTEVELDVFGDGQPLVAARVRVLLGEFFHPQDRDDVFEVLITLQRFLHPAGGLVVLIPDDGRIQHPRRRAQRVDRGINPQLGNRTLQPDGRVQVGKGGHRRRVGVVVRRYVNRLQRGDRPLAGGGDSLLQRPHFRRHRRLVAHRGGHSAEQRGQLGTGLDKAEDVVDEQEHVLVLDVAEVLAHGQRGQRHPQARARRLVHLTEDQHGVVDHAGLGHFQIEVVALAGSFADARERRITTVLGGDGVDQLLDQNRLAHARAAEQADLAALGERAQEVDDLDAGFEHFGHWLLIFEVRAGPVNRPGLFRLDVPLAVDRFAEHVEQPSQAGLADRNRNRCARVLDGHAADQTVGRRHRDTTHDLVTQVLSDFQRQVDTAFLLIDFEGVVDRRQASRRELDVHDRTHDFENRTSAHFFLSGVRLPFRLWGWRTRSADQIVIGITVWIKLKLFALDQSSELTVRSWLFG